MQEVLSFIDRQNAEQRKLLLALRQMILDAAPHVEESIKWKIPFYAYHGLLCYLNPQPNGIVLGFCQGALLSNAQGLLQGSGKEVRLLHLKEHAPFPQTEIRELLQEALLLNQTMQGRKNYYV